MRNVIEINKKHAQIGLGKRDSKEGPEKHLVDAFKTYIPDYFKAKKGAIAIFEEPSLETGYPDLVIVKYSPEVFRKWSPARTNLKPADLKILQYLYFKKGADSNMLVADLGVAAKGLLLAIERLLDAGLIVRRKCYWTTSRLSSIFGVRSIIAIEAKINNWNVAFRQAQSNQWFSSRSYVLSPIEKPSESVIMRAKETGVGIFLLNKRYVRRIRGAQELRIPSSYASWMLNEWIGRYIHHQI
ncbi:MAG: hypothetical protein V3W18_06470 [candidate division Zixibacteria bacterium]